MGKEKNRENKTKNRIRLKKEPVNLNQIKETKSNKQDALKKEIAKLEEEKKEADRTQTQNIIEHVKNHNSKNINAVLGGNFVTGPFCQKAFRIKSSKIMGNHTQ